MDGAHRQLRSEGVPSVQAAGEAARVPISRLVAHPRAYVHAAGELARDVVGEPYAEVSARHGERPDLDGSGHGEPGDRVPGRAKVARRARSPDPLDPERDVGA